MPKCKFDKCPNLTQYKNTKHDFCLMHLARIRRHGYPELKKERGEHALEKLPHTVDDFIIKNSKEMIDAEIVLELQKIGYKDVTRYNVGYRRRKLGNRKYLRGEIQKHKAWIRTQAIKKYGNRCELCSYSMAIDAHHIIPKYQGGPNEIDNLMVVCPNCHALITRNKITIYDRKKINNVKKKIRNLIKSFYINL